MVIKFKFIFHRNKHCLATQIFLHTPSQFAVPAQRADFMDCIFSQKHHIILFQFFQLSSMINKKHRQKKHLLTIAKLPTNNRNTWDEEKK